MTLTDKANIEDVLGNVRRQSRGAREANLSAIRSRGQLGSGLELAAANEADQAGIEQAHEDSLRVAAQAQDRALESILQSGKLAGDMDSRRFNQDFQKGSAADEIAKFNTQTRQQVQQRNVDTRNDAAARNLNAEQLTADRNVDMRNKQTVYNTEKYRETALDQMEKAKAQAAALTNQAQVEQGNAKQTADTISNIGSGVVKAFGSPAGKDKDDDDEDDDE